MKVKEKIEHLRELMKNNHMDAYIIPSSDAHLSEYVADYWKSRQWISGFTGSAGTVAITLEDAGLWTDGRYYIQAENQLKDSGIKLFRMADPGVPSFTDWLAKVLDKGSCVGFDGSVLPVDVVRSMEKSFKTKNITLNFDYDLINDIWKDRAAMPSAEIFVHAGKYAGKTRVEKLNSVREEMKNKAASHYLLSSLDDIAWLLNIRGNDVPNNPVVISNVVIAEDTCYLFVDSSKVTNDVKAELEADKIVIKAYNEIHDFLRSLEDSAAILFDPSKTNAALYNSINKTASKIECPNITTNLKAIKNAVEIENLKNCQLHDGVAMVKFLKWLKTSAVKENATEISVADKLEGFRKEIELFVGLSFDTIAGYKDNAAMMHYKATPENQYSLNNESFLLVDSGGQYFNGTTDITRTIALGTLTEEEKTDFTLVLKGVIALSSFKFLYGATGSNLDVIARQPMWERGLDYKCGTGHGVGFFLNVHEGPHRISQVPNEFKLENGMVITNEPGIYKEGKHGIRTENMILAVNTEKTEFGQFMKFETLTFCPIDLDAIKIDMLTESEIAWLNCYHKEVYSKLSPYLSEEEKAWLAEATREI